MSQEFGAPTKPKSRLPAWAWLLIVPCGCMVLTVPILAALLFPVFFQARERARGISCLSNIKQQALAMRMYSQDYDETLPEGQQWMDLTSPYVKSEATLHCPNVSKAGDATYGYAYNKKLSHLKEDKISAPQSTPMLYDSSNMSRNATDAVSSLPNPGRHGDGNNMGYFDGHARFVRPVSGSQ